MKNISPEELKAALDKIYLMYVSDYAENLKNDANYERLNIRGAIFKVGYVSLDDRQKIMINVGKRGSN